MKVYSKKQAGFTLIEMIVSLGLFSIVVTVSVGALLVLITTNQQLQSEQNVMTNLSFAIDGMAREFRTGTAYYCLTKNGNSSNTIFDESVDLNKPAGSNGSVKGLEPDDVQDCRDGRGTTFTHHGVAFLEGGESITETGGRILYYYDKDEQKIFRRVGAGPAQPAVSSGIVITDAEFYVTGSQPLSDSSTAVDQAAVTIFIEAKEAAEVDNPDAKTYQIQTTVTQRTLDI